jgi:phage/plasmid-associated DNA primase
MIEGCLIWQPEGLVPPQVVSEATDEYLASEDVINRWLEECCVKDPQAWTATADLYGSWKAWAENNGEFVGSVKRFVHMLEGKGYRQIRQGRASPAEIARILGGGELAATWSAWRPIQSVGRNQGRVQSSAFEPDTGTRHHAARRTQFF